MKRFELKPEFSFTQLEKKRITFGILSFVFFSLSFYLFGLVIKDGLRIFSELFTRQTWYLPSQQYYFLNYFLAFTSVVVSSMIMFEIFFNKPIPPFKGKVYRTSRIIVQSRGFLWYFIYWIFSFCVYLWAYFGTSYYTYCFDFLPDYYSLFILLMIVLYFSLWNGLLSKYKFVWNLILKHFILTVILSAALAFFVPQKINEVTDFIRSNQIGNKYFLDLPYSNIQNPDRIERRSLVMDIHIVRSKNSKLPSILYLVNNKECTEDGLIRKIKSNTLFYVEWERRHIMARLFVDKDLPMSLVLNLKDLLREQGIFRIYYVISQKPNDCDQPSVGFAGISRKPLPSFINHNNRRNAATLPIPPISPGYIQNLRDRFESDSVLNIKAIGVKLIEFRSEIYSLDDLSEILEIHWHPRFMINIQYDSGLKYSDYIRLLSISKNFIHNKREFYSYVYLGKRGWEVYSGNYKNYKKVTQTVPGIIELSETEVEFILSF